LAMSIPASPPIARAWALTATTFKPRMFAASPKQFGKSAGELSPASGVKASDPRFLAAQLQHRVCNALRESLLADGQTVTDLAGELTPLVPGMSYDRLVRVLRGETLMQMADLTTWASRYPAVRRILTSDGTWSAPDQGDDNVSSSV